MSSSFKNIVAAAAMLGGAYVLAKVSADAEEAAPKPSFDVDSFVKGFLVPVAGFASILSGLTMQAIEVLTAPVPGADAEPAADSYTEPAPQS